MSFDYFDVDVSEIPTRPRPVSPGRPSANPHLDAVKAIAGSGKVRGFTVPDPGGEAERQKLINRHVRWLRNAAHENERGVRVWTSIEARDGVPAIRINFRDTPYQRRPRGGKGDDSQGMSPAELTNDDTAAVTHTGEYSNAE